MSRIEELKRFLEPCGLSQRQVEMLLQATSVMLDQATVEDGKQRHFLMLVLTRENGDRMPTVVTSDLISTMPREWANEAMEEWLNRSEH